MFLKSVDFEQKRIRTVPSIRAFSVSFELHDGLRGRPQGPEGDGPAHQPDLPLPSEPDPRLRLAVRERQHPGGRPHHRLRRVHEPRPGRRLRVPRQERDPEAGD